MSNPHAVPARSAARSGREDSDHQAALLIDFDNVTMGIRSNLAAEFRKLLGSEIIRGNVAVQRAYADWRRYPQYIVPLSEASIDLIFAPAYGSSKKNATDIRLAIDALELVFTRPEIRTFILMSGDSDFSSLVLKLKEYGKYVIGVGIQESSSDLLVQNCDEYYSYSALTGLTKAGEETGERHDPWELVEKAILKMVERNDTMRSDRLKQVMLEIDSSFNEKEQGYSKFNRFVVEAASRGILSIQKMEAGQYAVAPGDRLSAGAPRDQPESAAAESGNGRDRGRGRRSGGRRGRGRGQRDDRGTRAESERGREQGQDEPSTGGKREEGGAAARSERRQEEEHKGREKAAPPERERTSRARPKWTMDSAVELLNRALDRLLETPEDSVRDSDVKRRMLEMDPDFDEGELGFNKFSKFLQEADSAGIIELTKGPSGNYHVTRPSAGAARPAEADSATEPGPAEASRRDSSEPDAESKDSRVKKLARRLFGSYRVEEREGGAAAEAEEEEERQPAAQAAAPDAAEPEGPTEGEPSDEDAERPEARGGRSGRGRHGGPRERGRDRGEPEHAGRDRDRVERDRQRGGPDRERGGKRSGRARERRRERSERPAQGERGTARENAPREEAAERAEPEPPTEEPVTTAEGEPGSGAGGDDRAARTGVPGAPRGTIRGRYGTLGRYRPPQAPPPILEGQTLSGSRARTGAPDKGATGSETAPAATARADRESGQREGAGVEPSGQASSSDPATNLPSDPQGIIEHVSRRYSGVGAKTAEALVEAFGPDVFRVLDEQPERVREVLPDRRAERVIEARREEREAASE